jgi:hypothetical protein
MFSPFKMHEHIAFDEFYYTCILLGYYYIRIAVVKFLGKVISRPYYYPKILANATLILSE